MHNDRNSARAALASVPASARKARPAQPARRLAASVAEPAAAPRGCTALKVRQLSRRVSQHFDHIVGNAGLKTTQYSLLSNLSRLEPVRPSALAQAMEMDASTLTRNLQPLIAQGWVEVGPGEDARSRLVQLTPAGRAKRADASREWKRAQLAFNERLGDARIVALHAMIDECLELISESADD